MSIPFFEKKFGWAADPPPMFGQCPKFGSFFFWWLPLAYIQLPERLGWAVFGRDRVQLMWIIKNSSPAKEGISDRTIGNGPLWLWLIQPKSVTSQPSSTDIKTLHSVTEYQNNSGSIITLYLYAIQLSEHQHTDQHSLTGKRDQGPGSTTVSAFQFSDLFLPAYCSA